MRIIELDAGGCKTPLEFFHAFGRAMGFSEERSSDIDALVAAMTRSQSTQPPCTIRIAGAAKAGPDVKREIEALAVALKDARLWRRNHRYEDIGAAIEIVP